MLECVYDSDVELSQSMKNHTPKFDVAEGLTPFWDIAESDQEINIA